MKEDQNTNGLRQIRRALLQAAKEDYLEALKDAPEAPPFSKNHRRWERRFLKDPFSLRTPHRPLWQRGLRTAACFVFVTSDPRFLCILRNGRSWRNALLETDRFARGLSSDRVY